MIDDIDRIEVIRGPGAAMWGANAVTGVINIVTKAPADTQGGSSASTQGARVNREPSATEAPSDTKRHEQDPNSALEDGNAPRAQWRARSPFSPSTRATVDNAIFHVGPLDRIGIDAYTRTDFITEWRFANRLSAMAIGRNLFDAAHAEFGGARVQATQVPRGASVRVRWTFR